MPFRSMKVLVFGLMTSTLLWAPIREIQAQEAPDRARVVMGLGSADQVLSAVEYVVVKLAGKKASFEDSIRPNLEIFLYGVSTDKPIRFDMTFNAEQGSLIQSIIPVANLKEFLQDNLDPIGIESKQDKADKELYQLSGSVYEGWLRFLPKPTPYAVIFQEKSDLPKGMPHPETLHSEQAEAGDMVFLAMDNAADKIAARKSAFDKYIDNQLTDFQKLTSETKEQFALRKELRKLMLSILQQWVAEAARIRLGMTINEEKQDAPTTLTFSALPETALAGDLSQVRSHVSQFAAIAAPDNSILSGRIHLPIDEQHKAGFRKIYELARPAVQQGIDENNKGAAAERGARKEITLLFLDVLTECIDKVPVLDAFIDITPVKEKHSVLLGIGATGADKINQIIEKIPAAKEGWKVDLNVDKSGTATIHKLTFGTKSPKSLTDFYGTSNEVYFGVSDNSFWISGGEGALASLKTQLEKAAEPLPEKGTGLLVSFKMNAHPILKNLHEITHDPELDLLNDLNFQTRNQKLAAEKPDASKKKEESRAGSRAANLSSFKWQETAIAALQGTDDRFELSLTVEESNELQGQANAQSGVLKAIGAVIAKFADETLK